MDVHGRRLSLSTFLCSAALVLVSCATEPDIVVVDPSIDPWIEPAPVVVPPPHEPEMVEEPNHIPVPEIVPIPDDYAPPAPASAVPYEHVARAAKATTVRQFRAAIGRKEDDVRAQRDGTTTHSWWPVADSSGAQRTLRMISKDDQVLGYGLWNRK